MWFHAQQIHDSYDPAPPYDTMFLDVPTTHQLPEVEDFNIRCNKDIVEAWDRGLLSDDMQQQVLALYDGEIKFVDDQLGRIFDYLKSIDEYDNTVVVVLADHGELFFEESEVDFDRAPPAHGAIYFDPCLRIPLILKPPAAAEFAVGKQVTTLATAVDVVPTVLDLVNLQAPEWLPGRSLVPWMRRPKTADHDDVTYFHEAPEGRQVCVGLRTSEWKFIRRHKISDVTKWRMAPDGNPEPHRKINHKQEQAVTRWLFDLVDDPAERRSVFETEPDVARDLEARLDAWLSRLDKATPSSYEDMSEQMLEALREAGYIRDE
jgi:arylsulfatase A-like enzyme